MNKILIIIQREFMTRIRKKSFLLITILLPFIFAALIFVPLWLSTIKSDEQQTVMVVDRTGHYVNCFEDSPNYNFEAATDNEDKFYAEDSGIKAVIVIKSLLHERPGDVCIYSRDEVPVDLLTIVEKNLNDRVRQDKLANYNVPGLEKIIDDVQNEVSISTYKRNAEGESTSSNTMIASIAGMLTTFIVYMFVLSYGGMVMQSVIEEKTNRIVELMISSVRPFQLMMGKIVGCALVGFVQMTIWGILLAIIITVGGAVFGLETQPAPDTTAALMAGSTPMPASSETQELFNAMTNLPFLEMGILFVLYFIGGYLLYASFFAAVGASINEQEDTNQFVMPVVLLMVFGFLLGSGDNPIFTPMVSETTNAGAALGSTLLAVLFAFEGWTNVGAIAGEMKRPGRDLPLAIVGGVSIIMAVYFVINMAYLWVLPADQLMNLESPASAVATQIFGPTGGLLIKIGIIVSVIGAANGFLMSGSRVAYQLAEMNTLPMSAALSKLNGNQVPANSILLIGLLGCIYSLSGQFDMMTDLGTFSCWIFYTLTFACVMKLRRTHPELERKYKVPLYPVIPILAILSGLYVIVSQLFLSGTEATLLSFGSILITLIGLPVYAIVKKRAAK